MSTEENKASIRRIFEEVLNKGDMVAVYKFVAPSYVYHGPVGMEYKGPDGLK